MRRAQRLSRESLPSGACYAHLLRGAVAARTGDLSLAISELHEAAAGFDSLDMAVYGAAASYREGSLLGGQQGKAQCERSLQRVRERASLAHAERLIAAAAPGYRE